MSRVYFEGWYYGSYVKAEDWYKDGLVYVNVRNYFTSTAVSRPDEDKGFLLKLEDPKRILEYQYTIARYLADREECRDPSGKLIPIVVSLPEKKGV